VCLNTFLLELLLMNVPGPLAPHSYFNELQIQVAIPQQTPVFPSAIMLLVQSVLFCFSLCPALDPNHPSTNTQQRHHPSPNLNHHPSPRDSLANKQQQHSMVLMPPTSPYSPSLDVQGQQYQTHTSADVHRIEQRLNQQSERFYDLVVTGHLGWLEAQAGPSAYCCFKSLGRAFQATSERESFASAKF